MRRPRWRKMTWVLILFTLVMFAWMIGGGISAGSECPDLATEAERTGCEAGTGIGVALIFTLWAIGFVALGLVWFMTRPRGRVCPACGESVKRGQTACPSCGFDLAAAARGDAQPAVGDGAGERR
ncbi:MAG TPA: zinc ribbon domain-containing protein [Solirubrobacterales bacterium]|nr:zinc ribbon domain-containing protein [Solirubrobacterales bacterium]